METAPKEPGVVLHKTITEDEQRDHSEREEEMEKQIAQKEGKAVFWIRFFFVAVLVGSTLIIGCWIYLFISRSEMSIFESKFKDDADKVFNALQLNLDQTLGSFNQFAVTLASYARQTNSSWPYVTHPDFALLGAKMLGLSKAFVITEFLLVTAEQRQEWENYTVSNDDWIARAQKIQALDENFHGPILEEFQTSSQIYDAAGIVEGDGPFLPSWQGAPIVPFYAPYNWDAFSPPLLKRAASECIARQRVVISETLNIPNMSNLDEVAERDAFGEFASVYLRPGEDTTAPVVNMYYPIIDDVDHVQIKDEYNSTSVGILGMLIYWNQLITDVLPLGEHGVVVVFENTCGQRFTYELDGPFATYIGLGDLHDSKYDYLHESVSFYELNALQSLYSGAPLSSDFCAYSIHIYPSDEMKSSHVTDKATIFTIIAILIFAFTSAVFLIYDCLVERRQKKVMMTAVETSKIVSHLFPATVRERLLKSKHEIEESSWSPKLPIRSMRTSTSSFDQTDTSNLPIADFFPEATVLIADISGFTAWSSARSPTQVFTLLEALYGAFDKIARTRKVFKIETIGDSYVAVTGVPTPQKDHARIMACFASDIQAKMIRLTRELETTLGPDTSDLMLRIGIHSGPVTAGVLRGDRSRFQLFGDTINTASRMESTGVPGRIQLSSGTASILESMGVKDWILPRDELVQAKGKGEMQTFWLKVIESQPVESSSLHSTSTWSISSAHTKSNSISHLIDVQDDSRRDRLIDWFTDTLLNYLEEANQQAKSVTTDFSARMPNEEKSAAVDEIKDVIDFPSFAMSSLKTPMLLSSGHISAVVINQLREYVRRIASLHSDNAFHNFEHASHVAMSVVKLLQSLSDPTSSDDADGDDSVICKLRNPTISFACIFSALIHDVDHPGVSNNQLIYENAPLALKYNGRSIAEQNSIDTAWDLFLQDDFALLRDTICPSPASFALFRQLVLNAVIATDVMDEKLNKFRGTRWNETMGVSCDTVTKSANQTATLILEYLIQASDISHTMQHWHIYRRWNERLYKEVYDAYSSGRSQRDPSTFWYEGELKFFDFYVIPLAEKLGRCSVLGNSNEEYLINAKSNRQEWKERGRDVVANLAARCNVDKEIDVYQA